MYLLACYLIYFVLYPSTPEDIAPLLLEYEMSALQNYYETPLRDVRATIRLLLFVFRFLPRVILTHRRAQTLLSFFLRHLYCICFFGVGNLFPE